MLSLLETYDLSQWLILVIVAILIGMTKTGISGFGLLVVPLLAYGLGAKASTGVMLPLLIMADVFAVVYYHRSANWHYILRLIPWAFIGVLAGAFTGRLLAEPIFKILLSSMVIFGIAVMVVRDFVIGQTSIPTARSFSIVFGLLGGFASMMANAAGPVFAVYLLSMRLPKRSFIGTGAWFFFILNLSKVPFHAFAWKTLDVNVVLTDLLLLPAIFVGAVAGIRLVRIMGEKFYRLLVVMMTLASAIFLLIR